MGYPHVEINEVEVRVGVEDGAPYVKWFINGEEVHEFNLPLAVNFNIPAIDAFLHWSGGREDNGSQDSAYLRGLLSGGAILKVVYPNG